MRALVVAFACLVVAPRAVPAQGDVPGQLLERKTATDILAAQPAALYLLKTFSLRQIVWQDLRSKYCR